jgi:FixJ family two-component response regulator
LAQAQLVAIIDDDELVRSSMASLIRSLGLIARTFASADEYLRTSDVGNVACVLTDVQMPGTSGLQLQQILSTEKSSPPVILMTAFPDQRVRAQALEAGAICFMEKPVSEKGLLDCLEQVLGPFED